MVPNRTNWQHGAYALAIQCGVALVSFVVLGLLKWRGFAVPDSGMAAALCLWTGAAAGIAWFISREHAHRQNDIADTTGVPVPQQNPIDGFRGWSDDAKLDALFPLIACALLAGGVTATILK